MAICVYQAEKEAETVNKKLGRLFRPGVGGYFVVMALFCGAALVLGHYWLAAGESAVTLLAFTIYMINRNYRDRQLHKYIQSTSNTLESMAGVKIAAVNVNICGIVRQ